MIDNNFKLLNIICYRSSLMDGKKLSNEHLVPIPAKTRTQERGERVPIELVETFLNRLQPYGRWPREIEGGHGNPEGLRYPKHAKVLLTQGFP